MDKNILGTNIVAQIGFLVHDIEKSARLYANFLGVDVPTIQVTDEMEKAQTRYRGKASAARAKLAFFKIGPTIELELIEPTLEPSTWRDDLNRKGEGVHHIAFVVKGMKDKIAKLERNGIPLLQTGEYTGGRYAYLDATRDLKVILELLEND
ncbi:MAG TPA: VOC family protein [Spirochaetia bacterium]|nr:VOC family protein [Spirochaetia bacterium]